MYNLILRIDMEVKWQRKKNSQAHIGFENAPDAYVGDNVFFVPKEARWDTIASLDFNERVFGDVIDLFTNMDIGNIEESKDLLGRTYKYSVA